MKWFRWFDAKVRCMVLHRDGNKVQWAEGSGESGTATITEAPARRSGGSAAEEGKARRDGSAHRAGRDAVEDTDPLPATESAATPAPASKTPATSETPADIRSVPALQFAAAALAEAMPKPAPITPSKLGMGEVAPVEVAPPPVDEEPAAEAARAAATRRRSSKA